MEKNKTYRNAIESLPNYEVSSQCWEKIKQRLDDESELARLLPQHKVEPNLWEGIEASLDGKKKRFPFRTMLRWSAAAAVVFILLLPFNIFDKADGLITSEELMMPDSQKMEDALNLEDDLLAYCSQNPDVCESPDFNNLNNMLNQLKTEKSQLLKMSEELSDPSIDTYINKVNTNIAQVQRKLLSMF